MTDKELLELAAKAAGIELDKLSPYHKNDCEPYWNPLTDDGDALRLAVKLNMHIRIDYDRPERMDVRAYVDRGDATENIGDSYSATRRAIVRAAAEIGKTL